MVEADGSDPFVLAGARARFWSHGEYRPRAVLMLHGYTHTPEQVSALSERFFAAGYNVLAPRAPQHGVVRQDARTRITAVGLREHAAAAWRVASGLGAEVGVAGISGGAVLATWLATGAGRDVRRLLVLAPFYGPHPRRARPAVATAMRILFGPGVLPDRVTDRGYSYTALAQYLRVSAAIPKAPVSPRLLHVAVALSAADDSVHPGTALTLPAGIAAKVGASFGSYLIPASASLGHDIVTPVALGGHTERIHSRYLELFEGSNSR